MLQPTVIVSPIRVRDGPEVLKSFDKLRVQSGLPQYADDSMAIDQGAGKIRANVRKKILNFLRVFLPLKRRITWCGK